MHPAGGICAEISRADDPQKLLRLPDHSVPGLCPQRPSAQRKGHGHCTPGAGSVHLPAFQRGFQLCRYDRHFRFHGPGRIGHLPKLLFSI